MNQQNMMQQFFDQQQANVNGFPGTGFQGNQQIPGSYGNGPTAGSNPYMANSNIRQQNGLSRYGMNESETFDMQSPSNSQTPPNFQNFMDPRLSGFDPRNRPNFDPNGMMPGMDAFNGNGSFPGKMRMNEMAAMFNNPAALAAFQRQRMAGMFNAGRENDFMSPTNPFGGFNPQQAAQLMQQQRMAAFQRQVQEQLAAQQAADANRSSFPGATNSPSNGSTSDNSLNQNNSLPNFGGSGSFPQQHNRQSSMASSDSASNSDLASHQSAAVVSGAPVTVSTNSTNQSNETTQKLPAENTMHRPPIDQSGGSDAQRNAAILAAAAVRAAAAASTRGRGGFPTPNAGGISNYPFGPRFPGSSEQMPSPFQQSQVNQPPEFSVLSPNKDMQMNILNASSPMSQGRATPRNGNPPPYSPMANSTDSNHSASGSVKGSISNISVKSSEGSQQNLLSQQSNEENAKNPSLQSKKEHEANHSGCSLLVAGSATKLSAPPTPLSMPAASPSPSPFQDDSELSSLSPSWPRTPLSPNAQKILKSRASPKQYEQLSKVYDLIDDGEKKQFLERYLAFMSVHGTPVTKLPVIGKRPLDLYTLFRAVCERGGIQQVMEKRLFREVLTALNLPSGNSALAYLVKSQYMKYLHAYEVKEKESFVAKWNSRKASGIKQELNVPTIALNDSLNPSNGQNKLALPSQNQVNNTFQMNSSASTPNWPPNAFPSNSMANSSIASSVVGDSNQFGPRMTFSNQGAVNPGGLPTYGQPGMPPPGYGGNQEMPPSYSNFAGYQNQMFPRAPMQNYNMRPGMSNDGMSQGWARGFSPRQGPPELFPEGLQRMPWTQQPNQRHPMSAFGTPTYPNAKPRGQMPPISRDSLQQIKYNAQQEHLRMQLQQHQEQQQQQRKQRLNMQQEAGKLHGKGQKINTPETKSHSASSLKRELAFPADCVEGVKPALSKRKKLTSKDLGPIEAWRIMMSLKSGLVAECTWAIDTLNILLADDTTITYFHLNKLPGLLDTLMDHYRRSLANLFNMFKEIEIPLLPASDKTNSENSTKSIDDEIADFWVGVCKNAKGSYSSNIASAVVVAGMKEVLNTGKEFWDSGGGDNTSHIRTSFPTKDVKLKTFPKGLTYVTKSEEEKQRKIDALKLHMDAEETENIKRNSVKITTDSSKGDNETLLKADIKDKNTVCMSVLQDLMKNHSAEKKEDHDEDPLVRKLLKDLEFDIPCDKKYLEDSKEFIEYLNRRLNRENRGNVQSEQCIVKQNTPFVGSLESDVSLLNRCVALSNIFRSLSFIQDNDVELAGHTGLLLVCGQILLHKHQHAITDHSQFKLGLDERVVVNNAISDDQTSSWWDSVHAIRENTLVMLGNIGGHLHLARIKENVYRPLIHGLIHWLVCRSSEALDPMPTAPGSHALSAKRLAMETLAKLTINAANVEHVISCPVESQLGDVADILIKQIARKHPIPTREFAIILLDNLAHSEQFAKTLAARKAGINNLVKFVYEAEKNTSNYLSSGGRVQPGLNAEDICGTTISLLRRSVNILLSMAKVPCNRPAITPYTNDILALTTSQMIDTSVLALLAKVLFELSE